MPVKTKELHAKMLAWRTTVKAPLPTANKDPAQPPSQKKAKRKTKAE
jgi:hypothetical protein